MRPGPDTVVVVSGAASGIGRALAGELHERGARLALLDIDGAALAAAAPAGASLHPCDIADEEAVESACQDVLRLHGSVHLLVNNAGVSAAGAVEELPLQQFHRAMDVNFWGVLHACRAFLPALRASAARGQPAAICNVLSDFALFSLPTKSAYAASKHAARALTEALGAELHDAGVVVTAAYPGATATSLVSRGFAVDAAKQAVEADFLGRGLAPEVVARRILRGIEAGRPRILIGRDTRAIDAAVRFAPALVQAALRRLWKRVPFL